MSSEVQRLAALVAKLDARLTGVEHERRLSHASLEGGGINVYQPGTGGIPGVKLGEQYDGSYAPVPLGGPTPPMPAAPTGTGGVERLTVRWDGTFASGPLTVAPQDWSRVEVHADTSPTPGIMFETLRGSIESPRGGELSVMGLTPDTDYYVWLVSRSQAGKYSDPSQVVGPVRVTKLSAADIDLSQIGGNTIYRGPTAPVAPTDGHKIGDLWLKTPENIAHRWEGDPASWVEAENTRIAQALQDAFDAQQTADQAAADALAAQTTASGKITTYYQAAAPTTQVTGDLWIDTDDGNKLHRWNGTAWTVVQDAAIQSALTNAATAQSTADGKVRIFTQTAAPTGMTAGDVGDLWIETDAGNKMWTWSGSAWVARQLGNAAIQPASLVARDVIATGTVSAALLESVLVLATTIIAGDTTGIHSRLTGTGLRVFDTDGDDPDTEPDEVARFGTATGDVFAIVGSDGRLIGSVDRHANFTGAHGSFRDLSVGSPDFTGRGGTINEMLDRRPRMLAGWGSDNGTYSTNTVAGRGIFDITARLYFGRMYMINVLCRVNGEVHNDPLAEIQVRWTQSEVGHLDSYDPPPPAAPTISSPIAGRVQASIARSEGQGVVLRKPFATEGYGDPKNFRDIRFLLCLARPVGGTTITMYGAGGSGDIIEMWVEDVGPYIQPTKTLNDGGGTATTPGPAPAPQAQRYNRSWMPTWGRNFGPSGDWINIPGHSQGLDPVNGNMRSYIGFSGTATDGSGLTMDQALNGAIIEEIGLYLYSFHWYYNSGGNAIIGFHGFRDAVNSYGGGDEWMIGDEHFTKPGGKWVSLTRPGVDLQNFATGVWKGIMLGAEGAGAYANYGRFDGANAGDTTPILNVTYRK